MLVIIGIVVVTAAVLGGFVLAGGPLLILIQPVELVMIMGAAGGGLLIGTPMPLVKQLIRQMLAAMKPSPFSKALYLDCLQCLYELLVKAKKNGLISLEKDLSAPKDSAIFQAHANLLGQHDAVHFICEALTMLVDGTVRPDDFEAVLDVHVETHHEEEAPAEIGHHVAVALVGTFLGILLSYGYVQPLAANVEAQAADATRFLRCIKSGLVAFARGAPPLVAVEVARHVIFSTERPGAEELSEACRNGASRAAA
jgi:chemotaxis protein MotA